MNEVDYNTTRPHLILKEYGRNIQKLAEYISNTEPKEERTRMATTLIELMKQITPNYKLQGEEVQKLWDDLYIMAKFEIDIDAPYPAPDEDLLFKKPEHIGYRSQKIKFRHYGRNIHLMIDKAIALEDPEEKEAAVIYIGKLMRTFYASWNKDLVDEGIILENIREISKNQLDIDIDRVREENLFAPIYKERPQPTGQGNHGSSGNRKRPKDNRKRPSNNGKRRKN